MWTEQWQRQWESQAALPGKQPLWGCRPKTDDRKASQDVAKACLLPSSQVPWDTPGGPVGDELHSLTLGGRSVKHMVSVPAANAYLLNHFY